LKIAYANILAAARATVASANGPGAITLPDEATYALTYKAGIAPSAGRCTPGSFLAPSEHHPSCLTCF